MQFRYILDELEIEYEEPQVAALDSFVEKLEKFPTTREFSLLARQSLPNVSAYDDPDATLLAWMEREEQLFRIVERKLIGDQVRTGFASGNDADVDGFLTFSKSVQNRRKSRAGAALEHHLEAIFETTKLKFERGVETENRNRPDFLFPGKAEYLDMNFPASLLTMLGAKSTLKDRWRQVLQEANRINEKHLLTLEPGISEKQTDQIRAAKLQLVVPTQLQDTFRDEQKKSLINVSDFIKLIRERQNRGR